jgi:hypothetical protein
MSINSKTISLERPNLPDERADFKKHRAEFIMIPGPN